MALVNVALAASGASFSASSTYSIYAAANAFDANDGTYWRTPNSAGETWLRTDLGQVRRIVAWRILLTTANGTPSYKIQSSDNDSDWTDRADGSNDPLDSGVVNLASAVEARYWRMLTPGQGGYATRVATSEYRIDDAYSASGIKSLAGVAQASVKSINGLAQAAVKSVAGVANS